MNLWMHSATSAMMKGFVPHLGCGVMLAIDVFWMSNYDLTLLENIFTLSLMHCKVLNTLSHIYSLRRKTGRNDLTYLLNPLYFAHAQSCSFTRPLSLSSKKHVVMILHILKTYFLQFPLSRTHRNVLRHRVTLSKTTAIGTSET